MPGAVALTRASIVYSICIHFVHIKHCFICSDSLSEGFACRRFGMNFRIRLEKSGKLSRPKRKRRRRERSRNPRRERDSRLHSLSLYVSLPAYRFRLQVTGQKISLFCHSKFSFSIQYSLVFLQFCQELQRVTFTPRLTLILKLRLPMF